MYLILCMCTMRFCQFLVIQMLALCASFCASGNCEDAPGAQVKQLLCNISCKVLGKSEVLRCKCDKLQIKAWTTKILKDTHTPYLFCRGADTLSYRWNETQKQMEQFSYLAEIRKENFEWKFPNIVNNRDGSITINKLHSNTMYQIKIWIVIENGTIFEPIFTNWTHTSIEHVNVPVSNVILNNYSYIESNVNNVITWTPPNDIMCYYSILVFDDENVETRYVTNTSQLFQMQLSFKFGTKYFVGVSATSEAAVSPGFDELQYLNFTTPTCIEIHNNLSICAPNPPENVSVNLTFAKRSKSHLYYNFHITWASPNLIPDMYKVSVISYLPTNAERFDINVTGDRYEVFIPNMQLAYYYQILIMAVAERGTSEPFVYEGSIENSNEVETLNKSSNQSNDVLIWSSSFGLTFVVLLLFLAVLVTYLVRRERYKENYHSQVSEPKRLSIVDPMIEEENSKTFDEWDLDSNHVVVQHILGEGEFGVVRYGWYQSENLKMELAFKMLKEHSNSDEQRNFQQEIEIMKNVGSHPHIVSIIGCCFKREFGQMLAVEFCAKGDLQSYLRRFWEELNYMTKHDAPHYVNSQNDFENKMYAIDTFSEDDSLKPCDLLSFARQIALGMEFLSKQKIVHRDLAARNVLVCNNKIVKVSDFGLSRDVYVENYYRKMKSGKVPLRWMALECITRQRYTAQSDVWSFGILLWEIVTLGANPYPGIKSEKLERWLQSGHRMERPTNCSLELYTLMRNCLKVIPKERPTFFQIIESLEVFLETETDYLNIEVN